MLSRAGECLAGSSSRHKRSSRHNARWFYTLVCPPAAACMQTACLHLPVADVHGLAAGHGGAVRNWHSFIQSAKG